MQGVHTSTKDGGGAYLLLDGSRAMTGDLDLAGNDLLTTNFALYEASTTFMELRDRTKTSRRSLTLNIIDFVTARGVATNTNIMARSIANATIRFWTTLGTDKMVAEIKTLASGSGEFNIPLAGDITMLATKTFNSRDVIPVTDSTEKLGDASHYFAVAYVDSVISSSLSSEAGVGGPCVVGTYLKVKVYSDATRGAAGLAGKIIYNSTDTGLNIDDGTNWRDTNGNIT